MILDELKHYKPYSISPGYHSEHILYGEKLTLDYISETTYPYEYETAKAIMGLVHSQYNNDYVYLFIHEQSLLFQIVHNNQKEAYLEYSLQDQRFIMASAYEKSDSLYRLLLVAINYIYNQYQTETFQDIYENWRHIDMSQHYQGNEWDANHYKYVLNIARRLIQILKDILQLQDCFLSLHYDSVEELLNHLHLTFNTQSLIPVFLFQDDPQHLLLDLQSKQQIYQSLSSSSYTILDVTPLYSTHERMKLPLFLQE